MADVITRLKVESSEYDAKLKRATQSLNEMTTAAERQGNKIATANKKNIELARSLGQMQTVSTSARGKMQELSQAIEAATLTYNRLSSTAKKGEFGRALNQSITQLQGRLSNLRTEMAAVQGQMAKSGGGGLMAGMGAGLSQLGPYAAGAAAVTAAISGMKKVVGDMVQTNMEFEKSCSNLAAILGTTRDQIPQLITQAKQLGATTMFTAAQVTELQTNLALLGFSQGEIMNSAKAITSLSAATGAGLGEAAALAGASLRSFGLNATEMERVASVLAVSTTKSALSFEKLATAMPIVSPVAKQFGFTIEDTVTLLGKLSDAGFDDSSAATATRNIFLNMANSSGKLAQALGRPIRSIEDLAPALADLKRKGIDLAEMLELTDKRSVAAFATFIDQADTMKALKDSVTDCSDALQNMVDEQLNNLHGSVTIMKSAWEGLMLTFSDSNGMLKKCTDALTELLTAWTNWRKRNQGGDAAIGTYELGLTDESIAEADAFINAEKASKKSADQIKADAETRKAALAAEEAELLALEQSYRKWQEEYDKYKNSGDVERIVTLQGQNPLMGTQYQTDTNLLYQQIAGKRDQMAKEDYIIGAVTTPTKDPNPNPNADPDGPIKVLKAQYKEQEKEQIAALDRMALTEEEYEKQVYEIKKKYALLTAELYAEGTKERAMANAAVSQLDIQYQGTQYRLANKGKGSTNKEEYTGVGEYSQKAVDARMTQYKKALNAAEFGSDTYLVAAEKVVDLTTFQNLLSTATKNGITLDPETLKNQLKSLDLNADIPDETWDALVNDINEKLKALKLDPIKLDVTTGNITNVAKDAAKATDEWQQAVQAVGQLGGALQGLEDPSAKVAGIIAQAIANIALTFATSLKGTVTPWDWIAAAISGTATMIGTIAAIKSATQGFADGGMVDGKSFSGDNIVARLNAGEGVLTAKGIRTANEMANNASGFGNLQLTTKVAGTDMLICLDNTNRARGGSRGHYARTH